MRTEARTTIEKTGFEGHLSVPVDGIKAGSQGEIKRQIKESLTGHAAPAEAA